MGKLFVDMFVTLDGVIQAPGAPQEDTEGGFSHGGWQGPFLDDASLKVLTQGIRRIDALLLGRKTYDIFAAYWPKAAPDDPIGGRLNDVPKFVASRRLKKADWRHSSVIRDVAKDVPRIKKRHKEVHTIGSADLVQSLLQHDLVDRMNLWVYPVVLGTGKRLFGEGTPPASFRLVEAKPFSKGAVHLVYEKAGKPTYVDMATQRPGGR